REEHGARRAFRHGADGHDHATRSQRRQLRGESVVAEMIVEAQKDEAVRLRRTHVVHDDVDHRAAVHRNERLGQIVAGHLKRAAAARHGNHDVHHASPRYLSFGAPGSFTTTVRTGVTARKSVLSLRSITTMSPARYRVPFISTSPSTISVSSVASL